MSINIITTGNLPSVGSIQPGVGSQRVGKTGSDAVAGAPFADLLADAIQNAQATTETSQQNILALAMGDSDDLHTGSIAALKSATAISYTANLTSAAIRAYNELMRMQI